MSEHGVTAAGLLTEKELAKRWGIPAKSIGNYRREGRLPVPALHLGKHFRYRLVDVEEFEAGGNKK